MARAGTIWPTPIQEQLLSACFAADAEALRALDFISAIEAGGGLDPASARLAPLLYRRWPSAGCRLVSTGQKAYLTTWRQNQDRMSHLARLLAEFRNLGIRCLVLKGAALALRHYRDLGLRSMRDFDLLIPEEDLHRAVLHLEKAGYVAEGKRSPDAVLRSVRIGHGWQFFLGDEQSCDLHWRPVVRCFSPEVTRLFWQSAENVPLRGGTAAVPCATDQLFHVCAHGLQWDWLPQIRWIADAVTVMREPIDWDRICRLAAEARMRVRLARALRYLQGRFAAPVPHGIPERLERSTTNWERREYRLLLKPCPLGALDSFEWHVHHFRRIRRFDAGWSKVPFWIGLPQYVETFLGARGPRELLRRLWPELKARLRR